MRPTKTYRPREEDPMRDGGYEELDAELYGFDLRIPRTEELGFKGRTWRTEPTTAPEGRSVTEEEAEARGLLCSSYRHVPKHEEWWYLAGQDGFLLLTPENRFVTRGSAPGGTATVHRFPTLAKLYEFVETATDPKGV